MSSGTWAEVSHGLSFVFAAQEPNPEVALEMGPLALPATAPLRTTAGPDGCPESPLEGGQTASIQPILRLLGG